MIDTTPTVRAIVSLYAKARTERRKNGVSSRDFNLRLQAAETFRDFVNNNAPYDSPYWLELSQYLREAIKDELHRRHISDHNARP